MESLEEATRNYSLFEVRIEDDEFFVRLTSKLREIGYDFKLTNNKPDVNLIQMDGRDSVLKLLLGERGEYSVWGRRSTRQRELTLLYQESSGELFFAT